MPSVVTHHFAGPGASTGSSGPLKDGSGNKRYSSYREGVVLDRPPKGQQFPFVNVGLGDRMACIDQLVPPHTRVTVKMPSEGEMRAADSAQKSYYNGCKVVSPAEPREVEGTYWGYTTRLASSLTAVWTECPYPGGYDYCVGTSPNTETVVHQDGFSIPAFNHILVVFGGLHGLEESVMSDDNMPAGTDPASLFDVYVNVCPQQGSATIRTEEAILVSLGALSRFFVGNKPPGT